MSLTGMPEVDAELKASADKFYKIFGREIRHLPNASERIHGAEIHEGDWETPGSVKLWKYSSLINIFKNYIQTGELEELKETVDFDDENKTITFVGVGGHVIEEYESYKVILQAVEKEERSMVKVIVEYEKFNETDEPPNKYFEVVVRLVKHAGARLAKA